MKDAGLDDLCINTIRFLAVDAVQKANSGHPGLPMGAAAMSYVLWTRFLRHNPANPHWPDRDRFVLSGGHGSMLLYALLHLTGYDLPMAQIQQFRQWGSRTPGHPESHLTKGVEATTGPLGQGIANAVGMAIAEAHLAARFNRPGQTVIDHYTYVIASDGDMMEGVAIGSLLARRSSRPGQADRAVRLERRLAVRRHLAHLHRGRRRAVRRVRLARRARRRWERSHRGRQGAQGCAAGPGPALADRGADGAGLWRPAQAGHLPCARQSAGARGSAGGQAGAGLAGRAAVSDSGRVARALSRRRRARGTAGEGMERPRRRIRGHVPGGGGRARATVPRRIAGWMGHAPLDVPSGSEGHGHPQGVRGRHAIARDDDVRSSSGGSADLDPSTFTWLKEQGDFETPARPRTDVARGAVGGDWSFGGRNLHFGVREHGMGAAVNGLMYHGGFIAYGSTFLVFSDYMRPAVRLSALAGLGSVWVYTHDSIGVGEDGPTHQPIEHHIALRAIPDLLFIRPGDANETAWAWRVAIQNRHRPDGARAHSPDVPTLDRSIYASAEGLTRGAYVLNPGGGPTRTHPDRDRLRAPAHRRRRAVAHREGAQGPPGVDAVLGAVRGADGRVRESVLPASVTARLAVEAGRSTGWHRWVGPRGVVVVDRPLRSVGARRGGDEGVRIHVGRGGRRGREGAGAGQEPARAPRKARPSPTRERASGGRPSAIRPFRLRPEPSRACRMTWRVPAVPVLDGVSLDGLLSPHRQ